MKYKAFLRKYAILGVILGLYLVFTDAEASAPLLCQISNNTISLLKRPVKQVCYELHYLERNHHTAVVAIGIALPIIFAEGAMLISDSYQIKNALHHGNALAMTATSLMHILAQEPGWAMASIGLWCTSEAIRHYNSHIPLAAVAAGTMLAQMALSYTRISCNHHYKKQPHYRNGNGCVLTRAVDRLKTWADTVT